MEPFDLDARAMFSHERATQLAASFAAPRPGHRMRRAVGSLLVGAGLRLAPEALPPRPPRAAAGA